jgi:hypothetical protein
MSSQSKIAYFRDVKEMQNIVIIEEIPADLHAKMQNKEIHNLKLKSFKEIQQSPESLKELNGYLYMDQINVSNSVIGSGGASDINRGSRRAARRAGRSLRANSE